MWAWYDDRWKTTHVRGQDSRCQDSHTMVDWEDTEEFGNARKWGNAQDADGDAVLAETSDICER